MVPSYSCIKTAWQESLRAKALTVISQLLPRDVTECTMDASPPHQAWKPGLVQELGREVRFPSTHSSQDVARVLIQIQSLGHILGSCGLDAARISPLYRREQLLTNPPPAR